MRRLKFTEFMGQVMQGERYFSNWKFQPGIDITRLPLYSDFKTYVQGNEKALKDEPIILDGAELKNILARGLYLPGVHAVGTNFEGSDLSGANFSGGNLEDVILIDTKMTKINLKDADIRNGIIIRTKRDGSINGYGANFKGCYATKATFRNACLENADLSDANLHGATLVETQLLHANLKGAYLKGAILQGTNLFGADLSGVDFRLAMIDNVNFDRADIAGANFKGIIFSNSPLDRVKNRSQAELSNAEFCEGQE